MVDPANKQLHFIIGIGRSGTTILNKILNAHPAIHALPEANFFLFFLSDYKNVTRFTSQHIDLMFHQIQIFAKSHPLVGWELDMDAAKSKILALVENAEVSYETLCKSIYSEIKVTGRDKSNATILIDKNPAFTLSVDHIANYLPKAKFILLVRDYRANVLSRKQNAYLKSPKVSYNATRWKVFNQIAYAFYKKNPDKVLLLRYEDLVSKHEESMKQVFEFLNVNAEEMDKSSNDQINISDAKVLDEHKKYFTKKYADLNKPVNTDRVNAWQKELSAEEIEICDAICGKIGSEFGYTAYKPVSALKKMAVVLSHFMTIVYSTLDIKKDQLLYHVSAKTKMDALIKRHADLGFLKK